MTAKVIQLGGLDEADDKFMAFIDDLKEGNSKAVYIIEKEDGTVSVGCSATDRRDIVYSLYLLQQLCHSLLRGEEDEE